MAFDQCHGNKDNLVAVSFSSCAEFCLYIGYYELFYIETRIQNILGSLGILKLIV